MFASGSLHKKVFVFVLIALAGAQISCGFHLRGAVTLPNFIAPVFLELNGKDDELKRELKALLSASGENVFAASIEDAKTVLNISGVNEKQRVVAVDNRGRAREYELSYKLRYELKLVDVATQSEIIKTNEIKLKRDLLFDPDSVLAVSEEKDSHYDDMRKDAAQLLLRQLRAVKQINLPEK